MYETDVSSQTKCQLVAYKCDSYESYLKGKCGTCDSSSDCHLIGYQAPNQQIAQYVPEVNSKEVVPAKYYIVTTSSAPWCSEYSLDTIRYY